MHFAMKLFFAGTLKRLAESIPRDGVWHRRQLVVRSAAPEPVTEIKPQVPPEGACCTDARAKMTGNKRPPPRALNVLLRGCQRALSDACLACVLSGRCC